MRGVEGVKASYKPPPIYERCQVCDPRFDDACKSSMRALGVDHNVVSMQASFAEHVP